MTLTRNFKDTIQARALTDVAFREALLTEAVSLFLEGDLDGGKAALRIFIKATVTYEDLAEATDLTPKSLIRMFGPAGNPRAANLVAVIRALQRLTGVSLAVSSQGGRIS